MLARLRFLSSVSSLPLSSPNPLDPFIYWCLSNQRLTANTPANRLSTAGSLIAHSGSESSLAI